MMLGEIRVMRIFSISKFTYGGPKFLIPRRSLIWAPVKLIPPVEGGLILAMFWSRLSVVANEPISKKKSLS